MTDSQPTTVGRIDLGPTEPRHLSQTEQRMMDGALRRSVKLVADHDDEINRLRAEIERLRSGIQAMIDGNYPNPRAYRSAPNKKCPHGVFYYDECEACNDAWLMGLLQS